MQVSVPGGDETATFKMYDASSGVTLDNTEASVVVNIDVAVGDYANPYMLNFVAAAPADTTAPVITLNGDASVTVEVGGTYTDAGAISDGEEIVTAVSTVDVNTVGSYTVTYTASDTAGNTDTATRTVTVSAPTDNKAPVITLNGDASVTVEVGETYTDAGATSDGGETVTAVSTVDVNTVGSYTVTYTAADVAGNADTATRTVNVVAANRHNRPGGRRRWRFRRAFLLSIR